MTSMSRRALLASGAAAAHARREHVARAYPRLEAFVAGKHHYDPGLVFPQHDVEPVPRDVTPPTRGWAPAAAHR